MHYGHSAAERRKTHRGLLAELREVEVDAAAARQEAAVAQARLEGLERAHAAEVAKAMAMIVVKDVVITELQKLLAEARRPWWRRWLD